MPSDIKECSLYSFTLKGQKIKTTPKDITARAAAEAAQTTANGKQDALTAAQLAAVNSGVTAEKVATYDAFMESDPTVPTWAKQATKPTYTAAEVGALPDTTAIPTKTSDLTNDSGFMTSYTETDPTVPTWAKAASKPTYTASEVGALPSNTAIPSKTSDLTNDSGFAVVQSGTPTFNNISYNLNYVSSASGKWQRIGNIVVFNVTYTMKGNISSSLANVFTGMPECDGYRHFLSESTTSETANRHVTVSGTSISLAGAHSSGTTYHASGAYIAKS